MKFKRKWKRGKHLMLCLDGDLCDVLHWWVVLDGRRCCVFEDWRTGYIWDRLQATKHFNRTKEWLTHFGVGREWAWWQMTRSLRF